jgi:hypothetical protein
MTDIPLIIFESENDQLRKLRIWTIIIIVLTITFLLYLYSFKDDKIYKPYYTRDIPNKRVKIIEVLIPLESQNMIEVVSNSTKFYYVSNSVFTEFIPEVYVEKNALRFRYTLYDSLQLESVIVHFNTDVLKEDMTKIKTMHILLRNHNNSIIWQDSAIIDLINGTYSKNLLNKYKGIASQISGAGRGFIVF